MCNHENHLRRVECKRETQRGEDGDALRISTFIKINFINRNHGKPKIYDLKAMYDMKNTIYKYPISIHKKY